MNKSDDPKFKVKMNNSMRLSVLGLYFITIFLTMVNILFNYAGSFIVLGRILM